MTWQWSTYAEAIFDHAKWSNRSLLIQAVAGAGKTTVLKHIAETCIEPKVKVLCSSFGRKAVAELNTKLPRTIDVRTLNSLGHKVIAAKARDEGRRLRLVDRKSLQILRHYYGGNPSVRRDAMTVVKLVSMAKANLLTPVSSVAQWKQLIVYYGLNPETLRNDDLAEVAAAILENSIAHWTVVDYDDQIYLPVVLNMPMPRYDIGLLDESQDMTLAQIELVKMCVPGKIISTGDRAQSLYGFRGASIYAMDQIKTAFECDELPLSICYRCAQSVVREAKQIVPQIEPWEQSPPGVVRELPAYAPDTFEPGDMIVARKNAPLLQLAYNLITAGRVVEYLGKDLAAGLTELARTFKRHDNLLEAVDQWEDKQVRKLLDQDRQLAADLVTDRARCIRLVINRVADTYCKEPSVDEVVEELKRVFRPTKNAERITLATIHQAKGLEADRVFVLNPSDMPVTWAKQDWEKRQEQNMIYVARTRARESLFYIESENKQREVA